MSQTLENAPAVIILTASAKEGDLNRGLEAGADDFVSKSGQWGVLRARIQALMRRRFLQEENFRIFEELKTKGPNSKRELSGWGQIGQGALSMGCVVAAATGQIELGIPCVIGGAAYTAGLQYMTH